MQCSGLTKAGKQCTKTTKDVSGYCHLHQNSTLASTTALVVNTNPHPGPVVDYFPGVTALSNPSIRLRTSDVSDLCSDLDKLNLSDVKELNQILDDNDTLKLLDYSKKVLYSNQDIVAYVNYTKDYMRQTNPENVDYLREALLSIFDYLIQPDAAYNNIDRKIEQALKAI